SILTVTLGASVAQPRSIEVRDELGGRRALGNALLLHGTPEVEQAEHRLRLAQTQDLATSRSLEQRYRAPVTGQPALVRAEQHDVSGHGGGEQILAVLRGLAPEGGAHGA